MKTRNKIILALAFAAFVLSLHFTPWNRLTDGTQLLLIMTAIGIGSIGVGLVLDDLKSFLKTHQEVISAIGKVTLALALAVWAISQPGQLLHLGYCLIQVAIALLLGLAFIAFGMLCMSAIVLPIMALAWCLRRPVRWLRMRSALRSPLSPKSQAWADEVIAERTGVIPHR